jgi:DNA (cytosine-5)-methyltransferase 1
MPSPLSRPTKSKKVVDPNYPALQITAPQLHDHFYDTRLRPGVELFESHVMKQHHPVYGVMNFPDDEGQPARTVMATEMVVSRETLIVPVKRDYKPKNLGKRPYADVLDEYHNDSSGGYRRLTVRELACVQGFPITYQLAGKSSSIKHKQIGNAVSPFISRAFGRMFAYEYLGLSDIATISEQKLRLSKPKDYSAYDAYEHVGEWLPKEYKKNSQKFYAHLRTTKADGQRLDFSILPNEQEPWKAMLCLGSGKNYKRLTIDEALVFTLRKAVNDGQKAFNGEVEAWISSILNAIDSNKDNQTGTQNQEKGFDATGRPIKGSPFALVEQELDAVIRKTVNGAYDSVTATNVSVDFKSVGITRPISVYTIIAAAAMARIARNANQSR